MDRTLPLLIKRIIPDLLLGKTVMVVAHANSLRGVVKYIDDLSEEQITKVGIPNGIPLIFKFKAEGGKLKPIVQEKSEAPISGEFMEKKGLLRKLLQKEAELAARVPGFVPPIIPFDAPSNSNDIEAGMAYSKKIAYQFSMIEYKRRNEIIVLDSNFILNTDIIANRSIDGNVDEKGEVQGFKENVEKEVGGVQIDERMMDWERDNIEGSESTQRTLWDPKIRALAALDRDRQILQLLDGSLWDPELGQNTGMKDIVERMNVTPKRVGSTSTGVQKGTGPSGQYIVIIRHGKTEYNKLGLFTGWEDVSLAREGVKEAMEAGLLLKKHGITFDVVYTSWLSRAIETAWLVLDELDLLWLPIIKTWRLNERMYGALTGLSKVGNIQLSLCINIYMHVFVYVYICVYMYVLYMYMYIYSYNHHSFFFTF
jgi:2,3-bisphosphoglycerate-dependent phosphoglycerate mutase